MSLKDKALQLHAAKQGKIEVNSKVEVATEDDLTLAYTPGVAQPCTEIAQEPKKVYDYTAKGNLVAIVSDGTAVLGLGDIGPEASLPVMEGKAVLFKEFAGVDAFPICLDTTDSQEIIETVTRLAPTFGGVNLEDISAPRCLEIEEKLQQKLDIPVFHDDQHGTAIVVLAGLINGAKQVGKKLTDLQVVINGAGAAGLAIADLLVEVGIENITLVDKFGALSPEVEDMNWAQARLAAKTNPGQQEGSLAEVIPDQDVFIGVSAPGVLTQEMVASMATDPIIFALANPTPEINPELAHEAGAKVVATGRSDYPNQVNNLLAFPGVFKGALQVQATEVTSQMKIAASRAIADLVSAEELSAEAIIPAAFNEEVVNKVAWAVAETAIDTGLAAKELDKVDLKQKFR
ncbi:NAD(P)-dependent malic enzyme [Halanaerobaculum tunisiense]